MLEKDNITAVILAGGRATRMGGDDKGLIMLNGKAMVEYVLNTLQPQVLTLLINANRNIDRYEQYGYPVIADELGGFHGPLAGIASAMRVAETEFLLTTPCDSPFLPSDLAARLYQASTDDHADICVAHNGERLQPVFSLIRTELHNSLENYLQSGERKIDLWYKLHAMKAVDFSDKPDTFLNINTPEDIKAIEQRLQSGT